MIDFIVNIYRSTIVFIFLIGVSAAVGLTMIGFAFAGNPFLNTAASIAILAATALIVGTSGVLLSINDHLAALRQGR